MPASTTTSSPTSTNGRLSRSEKSNKTVILKLSSGLLGRFPGSSDDKENNRVKESNASSPVSTADLAPPASSADNASDVGSTTPATVTEVPRRKGIPGPKPGSKRGLHQVGEVLPKPRGKPGPKKKPRLYVPLLRSNWISLQVISSGMNTNCCHREDGTIDHSKIVPAAHKLGPKANQGAINAGLRALDRSGAPCRKWERKPFQLKSFTGVLWQVPTWRTPKPKKTEENGDSQEGVMETADSDSKANNSAILSEKSNSGDGDLTPNPMSLAESPTPTIAMAA
jgi:INO80 complex subunit Ies4.